jgi:hypothetical protein
MIRWLALFQILAIVACGKPNHAKQGSAPAAEEANKKDTAARKKTGIDEANQIAALIDPEKLGTLKERGANPRIQKITAILAIAKATGKNPKKIAQEAVGKVGWGNTEKGDLTSKASLRNLDIAEKLGATTPEDIDGTATSSRLIM